MAAEAGGGSSKVYLKISGNIWIDKAEGKGNNVYNDLYDSGNEDLYKGKVKVTLIKPNGTAYTSTDTSNGAYSIPTDIQVTSSSNISSISNSLNGYYLKLEYDSAYSTVSPKFEEKNGSKALIMDGNKGIAYIYNLSDYMDYSGFYSYPTLSYMNMGLISKSEESFDVDQAIEYVKLAINGYTYTYKYGGTGNSSSNAAPKINWETQSGFTRTIYPSDIAYSMDNDWDDTSLQVYVVYKITIRNNTELNYGRSKNNVTQPISYVEVGLDVESLYNNYDSSRYQLETKYDSNKYEDFKNWNDESTGKAKYTGDKFNSDVVPNKPQVVYIQFKVKKEALVKLLQSKETYEKTPTTAIATGHHDYWEARYEWVKSGDKWVRQLKTKDLTTANTSPNKSALYLKLKLSTERTITGTVFEDNNTKTNGEVIGNGKIDSNENKVQNVKVDLLMADSNGKITNTSAKVFRSKEGYAEKSVKDLNIVTNSDGIYSIEGITPGKYYVKFTYGDGTSKYTIADYKSTVVTDPYAAKAQGDSSSTAPSTDEWYKHLSDTSCSVAIDDLNQREDYNKNKSIKEIDAKTALMSVSIENTTGTYATITTKEQQEGGIEEIISGINLGIITIPEISLLCDKVVSNIQITNAQGNIIVDGNPMSKNLKGASNLDSNTSHLTSGSNYIKAEIDEQELYGSTLKLTYAIIVKNNSEVNYYEKDIDKSNTKKYGVYYKFGKTGSKYNSTQATITINEIKDYLDSTLSYVDNSITSGFNIAKDDNEIDVTTDVDTYKAKTLTITANKEIKATGGKKYSSGNSNVETKVEFTATRLLSTDDKDLSSTNTAQVTQLKVTNTPALIETVDSSKTYFNDDTYTNPTKDVYVAITLPTGSDKLSIVIYSVAGVIALAVMVAGIMVIKKRVLNK